MTDVNAGLLRPVVDWQQEEGSPAPMGATWVHARRGYNFALYSRHATSVTLLFYREGDVFNPCYEYRLDYLKHKTARVWHCWVPGDAIPDARYYAYRVDGPNDPMAGHRFDRSKILIDPFATEVFFPKGYARAAACTPGLRTDGRAPLGVLPARIAGGPLTSFDWGDDLRPRHTYQSIVYELHVKGFTAHPSSGVSEARRGTFFGLIDTIPYLQELGITVVELLPVHQFDPQEGNYWGYMTLNFFAPHHDYADGAPIDEFRLLVRAMHEAGIEVWLDVVYNHTSEGDQTGPTYCYRGIDNRSYYLLQPDRREYINDTGTGNTLRCANPGPRGIILSSLIHWAQHMHVDGFRFDLASILTRNNDGSVNTLDPAVVAEISTMARYNDIKLVAEAWDIGSYQLGRTFPGQTWLQWNGKFRDDVRGFVKGDDGLVPALMRRLYGSDDLFPDSLHDACRPYQSVNFITAHDGFCLYDLTAYNEKHNEANGHHSTDGSDINYSWNCGWEGDEGAPPETLALRRRQVKNFFSLLMLSNGTPMFCAGDEFLNTQHGNNNPYNQDNVITWLNWDLLEQNRDIFRFFQKMIAFRKAHPTIMRSRYWRDDVRWYGVDGPPDQAGHSHTLAYFLSGASVGDDDLYVMINAYWEDLEFWIAERPPRGWLRVADTRLPSPHDIVAPGHEIEIVAPHYTVGARSVVVLRSPRG
ncbi:isoamylase [Oscillochloris sp. ZM17-4]|uniref:glycogen debranching protein n=1 Tax=Oscillochloris sp. ZM17-4 TaxID=2866714 RepID=UPI001C738602|nr:isoamylase [Oscillochloris sp. ZM17-4]MBX0329496.1 isoamylase [Oscillochloris sp. ZM17-4]